MARQYIRKKAPNKKYGKEDILRWRGFIRNGYTQREIAAMEKISVKTIGRLLSEDAMGGY